MHTIRLRGPWHLEPIEQYVRRGDDRYARSTDGLPANTRLTMPADWSSAFGEHFRGRVRYHRLFQSPTGLDLGERVWLVVEPPRSRGAVKLNGKPLGDIRWRAAAGRFDITDLLEDYNNRLEIVVEHPALDGDFLPNDHSDINQPGGLIGEVRLEIEE
jgi:hypothetical protein